MAIQVNLDVMLARRKMSLTELSSRIGISLTALSLFKTGKLKGVRFSSLNAICCELDCQPGDVFEYVPDQIPETRERSES
jgi:putative transcriptional regulator